MKKQQQKEPWIEGLDAILVDIGLTEPERNIFSMLIEERGALRVTDIAKRARQNRSSTYGVLDALAKRGLVISTETSGVLRYQSIDPRTYRRSPEQG